MAEPLWPRAVELSDFLVDMDAVQQKFRIAPPVVVLASELLKTTPRRIAVRNASELVAALLVRASHDPSALGAIVGDYRETQAHQILDTRKTEGLFTMPTRPNVDLG